MTTDLFHPIIQQWFSERFGEPTDPQRRGWPEIAAGRHTLIAAPTGSGKTLAAFMVCLDRLLRQWLDGHLEDTIEVVYISPLKALSNDIQRNLQTPLEEIRQMAVDAGLSEPPIRTAVRTGDTPQSQRQAMLRRPPHILVTTPESLYLLLTSQKGRERLRSVKTVIVDEIHALARDKRGSHLALSLERLSDLCDRRPVRIGLSATQRPIDEIARFLVGAKQPGGEEAADCAVVDCGHARDLDLALETPPSDLSAVCSHEQWAEVYERLVAMIAVHRSTLIFVNTRRMAERVSHHLTELLGEEAVASHHGSLSKKIRLDAEQRLKSGELKAIVATASLELGIDIGYIDLVCQIGSPRSIATFLQRVGRSGHSLKATPKGRMMPLTRDELIECLALVRAVRAGRLDTIEIPQAPLDILAQQVIAAVAAEEWDEAELFDLCRRAWPYRNLSAEHFEEIVNMVSEGVSPSLRRGAYLHRDRINRRLRARKGARLAALTNGGAIPETAEYRVVVEADQTFVGTVDEDFAIESLAGDVFLLGNTSWRIVAMRGGEVLVRDAEGAPPNIPFWFGEAPGRTIELSQEISKLRGELAELAAAEKKQQAGKLLIEDCGANDHSAQQAVSYIEAQLSAIGLAPTIERIVFERFFDESGGMQLVIHAPLGARINRAWGLALRKRFCRSFDFELQAVADDNGIVLSLSPQHSFPIEQLFKMLGPHNGQDLLEQALLAVPMFQVRWRWNVIRALAVLRNQVGKKVPPFLQRFRAEDILAATFPETVGCLENHSGDIEMPDHPLVRQTVHDCLTEAMDIERWLHILNEVKEGRIELVARDTREPSPFSHELLNANPYAFLDDAPLEERRTRAVATRRTLSPDDFRDLARLDPQAIRQVSEEAWPLVRDADEMHDALMSMVVLLESESSDWTQWLQELARNGRAAFVIGEGQPNFWIAAERWPIVRAVYDNAKTRPAINLPSELEAHPERHEGWVEIVRGRMTHNGPLTALQLGDQLGLDADHVHSSLEALEGKGIVMRGRFTDKTRRAATDDKLQSVQWCERRLLARIHRLTLQGLRKRIKPVEPTDFMRFLADHHHLTPSRKLSGVQGVLQAIEQLQGFQSPAAVWESQILTHRVADYDSQWLDQLFLSGQLIWGRLSRGRKQDKRKTSAAAMTRSAPISMMLREDLPALLPPEQAAGGVDKNSSPPQTSKETSLRANAQDVLAALTEHGALFFADLQSLTRLLPAHLEEALLELAGAGLVTSDAFAAVRTIVDAKKSQRGRHRKRIRSVGRAASPIGRWSRFPGRFVPPKRQESIDRWCRQLLARYGVVFRDLLAREPAAPPWYELVALFRRMEMRGEVRSGRFITGVSGEQYGTEAAVRKLRKIRDSAEEEPWIVISAADPLNLSGVIDSQPRVSAAHRNALILQRGQIAAAKQVGQIVFFAEVDQTTQAEMTRALQRGQRTEVSAGPQGRYSWRKAVGR